MARKINTYALDKLKQWEGLRLNAYQDAGGAWTIGYGHAGEDVRRGMTISTARAEELLVSDVARFEHAVDSAVKVPLSDNQFGALVSFAFNVGEEAFRRSTLLKKLNAGEYGAVPAELARWVHAGKKRLQGLVNRRAAEAGLWASGAFVTSAPVAASVNVPALLTKETAVTTAGMLAAIATAASTPGPLQWVFAAILAGSYGLNAIWGLIERRNGAQ